MDLKKEAMAGTLESSDIQVMIIPISKGIEIDLKSSVMNQYGNRIREVIEETLKALGVKNAKVIANDKGALDCTIKARIEACCYRASEMDTFNWEANK